VALDKGALRHATVLCAALIYLNSPIFEVQHYAAAAHTVVLERALVHCLLEVGVEAQSGQPCALRLELARLSMRSTQQEISKLSKANMHLSAASIKMKKM
jgi:hypothetical protein